MENQVMSRMQLGSSPMSPMVMRYGTGLVLGRCSLAAWRKYHSRRSCLMMSVGYTSEMPMGSSQARSPHMASLLSNHMKAATRQVIMPHRMMIREVGAEAFRLSSERFTYTHTMETTHKTMAMPSPAPIAISSAEFKSTRLKHWDAPLAISKGSHPSGQGTRETENSKGCMMGGKE